MTSKPLRLLVGLLVGLVALGVVAAGVLLVVDLVGEDDTNEGATLGSAAGTAHEQDAEDPAYEQAISDPREDSKYPAVGDPGVDALHYGLDLEWDVDSRTLTGTAELTFRSTVDAAQFQLDLDEPLGVEQVTVDGAEVEHQHTGKNLVVKSPVVQDQRYLVVIDYAGTPQPYDAPTTRDDFDGVGFTITETGDVWTMQEPYGAFTWYPVNDHPSDKAFYDFTITTAAPRIGVANGKLVSREEVEGNNVTTWHLDSPASSYLVTIAIADYELTRDTSASGVPLTYWTPPEEAEHLEALRYTPDAIAFLEKYLGPFPFSSLGSVVVDSDSAMETQQMITYGNTEYTLSPDVIVHEIAHHWYGNTVSPTDWRDVWMNEGMAMYLQGIHEARATGRPLDHVMDDYAFYEKDYRKAAGPPGDFDSTMFGVSNIYYGPALMWHELRKKLGGDAFWAMVREWPTVEPMGNATREEYLAWIEEETGEELTAFFDAWLLGARTPPRS